MASNGTARHSKKRGYPPSLFTYYVWCILTCLPACPRVYSVRCDAMLFRSSSLIYCSLVMPLWESLGCSSRVSSHHTSTVTCSSSICSTQLAVLLLIYDHVRCILLIVISINSYCLMSNRYTIFIIYYLHFYSLINDDFRFYLHAKIRPDVPIDKYEKCVGLLDPFNFLLVSGQNRCRELKEHNLKHLFTQFHEDRIIFRQ